MISIHHQNNQEPKVAFKLPNKLSMFNGKQQALFPLDHQIYYKILLLYTYLSLNFIITTRTKPCHHSHCLVLHQLHLLLSKLMRHPLSDLKASDICVFPIFILQHLNLVIANLAFTLLVKKGGDFFSMFESMLHQYCLQLRVYSNSTNIYVQFYKMHYSQSSGIIKQLQVYQWLHIMHPSQVLHKDMLHLIQCK